MKVLHLLASNKYSGAENVACQIINMFDGEIEMAYCSPTGQIETTLQEKGIKFFPIEKLSKSEIQKVVAEYKPNILHCHDLKATIIGSRIKNVKIISHVHGNKSNMSKISFKSMVYNIACRKVSGIIWVSNSCYEDYFFKKQVASKSVVLPNIISIKALGNKIDKDKNMYNYDIVYLGRLVYEKNPIRLIEIAKELKNKKNDFTFAIVGNGEYKQNLVDLITEYNLQDNVFCLGFNSNPYKILADSKVMLMTSIMEGTPMCAIEALALGVPIVSTKTDGMVDLIKNDINGYLYEDNKEAVEKILAILQNKNKQKDLSKKCIAFSKEYNDIKKYKDEILKKYNK